MRLTITEYSKTCEESSIETEKLLKQLGTSCANPNAIKFLAVNQKTAVPSDDTIY